MNVIDGVYLKQIAIPDESQKSRLGQQVQTMAVTAVRIDRAPELRQGKKLSYAEAVEKIFAEDRELLIGLVD